ncbi:hypothetical protein ACFL3F_02215 [Planctomycetota bacterium]
MRFKYVFFAGAVLMILATGALAGNDKPMVSTAPVSLITDTSALIHGVLHSDGNNIDVVEVDYIFYIDEVKKDVKYGYPDMWPLGNDTVPDKFYLPRMVPFVVADLEPGSTHWFQFAGENSAGESKSAKRYFTTLTRLTVASTDGGSAIGEGVSHPVAGTVVPLVAVADPNMRFAGWTTDGPGVVADPAAAITSLTAAGTTTVTANFISDFILTVAPLDAVVATGDDGDILSLDGVDVGGLILATVVADYEKYEATPAANAENFMLNPYASLDDANEIVIMFTQPTQLIYIVERGANDLGVLQALDSLGQPIGLPGSFAKEDWAKPGYSIAGQDAGAISVTSSIPISGLKVTPAPDASMGLDPASVSALP